jgi:hypothetical protein
MIVLSPCLEFEVDANDAVSLEQLAGWTLTPANAQIWLTEENDRKDYWLKPGEHHVVHGGGKVVLSSTVSGAKDTESPTVIRLSPPAHSLEHKGFLPSFMARHRTLPWS